MKKVILELREKDVVALKDVDKTKAYIADFPITGKSKLHRIDNGWVFAQLQDSYCWANGTFDSMEAAVRTAIRQGADVYEISSTKDFIRCLEM